MAFEANQKEYVFASEGDAESLVNQTAEKLKNMLIESIRNHFFPEPDNAFIWNYYGQKDEISTNIIQQLLTKIDGVSLVFYEPEIAEAKPIESVIPTFRDPEDARKAMQGMFSEYFETAGAGDLLSIIKQEDPRGFAAFAEREALNFISKNRKPKHRQEPASDIERNQWEVADYVDRHLLDYIGGKHWYEIDG